MDQVYFVTGSSRGLGRRVVEAALEDGARVAATARDPRTLQDLVARYPGRVRALPLDVTDADAAAAAVGAAVEAFGRLDVVVNNAGQGDRVAFEDTSLEVFRRQLETNFMGTVHVTRAVLPVLREQGGGRIIQVSSLGGRIGSPGMTAYQSAKWAVGGFSEALAAEVAPLGIRVTVLEPGGMRTDWAGSSMTTPPVSAPYEPTVGAAARAMAGFEHMATSDPAKVAALVLQVARLDRPPLRLLAGSDAYEYGRERWRQRVETDALWERLSRSTDADDARGRWQEQRGTNLPAAEA
ncbi:SDR family NAD(P)-dependent oxidoreductase [Phycicoccus endophyticus]|uniref:SDR family NAD(P)-dependent oxidoreductase n=1 Tax=Phycicoccus endophyticus TaxID=1690220 RepID=A0A7G9R1S3_9MICO|nr:SDR family NAD(P)-dependent oxidoreductase [Phycicoccus endophyticus]NHI18654.1 SDR family NAD(P)-dependent oxidoreductase [Phycicoccus endophyticus]QNN49548.1 SDR family NAD(P)-dependent oxidoreductase [Phycicoccus endophyticus]GGL37476.1 short-chain dehydrogenase/reductase [Phycicoccus endophyticus]